MVNCPKCGILMNYRRTECDATSSEESRVVIDATAYYTCEICYSEVQLKYTVEVVLK